MFDAAVPKNVTVIECRQDVSLIERTSALLVGVGGAHPAQEVDVPGYFGRDLGNVIIPH